MSGPAWSAIDDAGMKYVSAAEGFGGSIHINWFNKQHANLPDPTGNRDGGFEINYGDSRLYLVGDADMSSTWVATYYFELRPGATGRSSGTATDKGPGTYQTDLEIYSQDVGLRGPLGWVRVGRVESVSSALLPSADRTNDIGFTGRELAEDYESALRWTSPDIKGLRIGASLRAEDKTFAANSESITALRLPATPENFKDSDIDQWDLALVYSMPAGLDVGVSYAKNKSADNRNSDAAGFRLGASYAPSNWGVAYNFHRYRSYDPIGLANAGLVDTSDSVSHYQEYNSSPVLVNAGEVLPNGRVAAENRAPNSLLALGNENDAVQVQGNRDTLYTEHVVDANATFGKFNMAANYSTAVVE
ncbi:MAG: porin, partial [Betaproteobacteria bacterium]|nr:porin [Betaproteobacteria bacterium]